MRAVFLEQLVGHILAKARPRILKVAINGSDGSGKTRLADELTSLLKAKGANVIRASIDNFHNPRAVRYAKGRSSPEGFYRDSFNFVEFRAALLDPLSEGGNLHYRSAAFDHVSDNVVNMQPIKAKTPAILLVDGIFLLNHQLRNYFDLSIFLEVEFTETFCRMAVRDGTPIDQNDSINLRYKHGQKLYFAECNPQSFADILIDYNNFMDPKFLRVK